MIDNYNIFTTQEHDKWNSYLEKLPFSKQDIYFTPEYYKIYENYGDGEGLCFVYQQGENIALYPFLKNNINQLGYQLEAQYYDIQGTYGYNGILTSSQDKDFREDFFKLFKSYCKEGRIIAEFTRFHPLLGNHQFSEDYMKIVYDRKTVSLDIPESIEDIWDNSYSSNNRNMIRKARKRNVEIIETAKEEDYQTFYNIYVETMDNVGSESHLYFNQDYFSDFFKLLPSNHQLILAKYNDEIIVGMILMMYKDYAHYHLSARKSEFGSFALNNLFLDYAIQIAHSNNCKQFHFGGGTANEEKDSLLKFKSNFSKTKSDFYVGKKIHNEKIYNEVMEQWKEMYPDSCVRNKNKLLGYREI